MWCIAGLGGNRHPFVQALDDRLALIYASESEVIRDGLRTLKARDAALENWLRGEVAKSYDEFATDPSTGIPAAEVMARLRAAYRERLEKPKI